MLSITPTKPANTTLLEEDLQLINNRADVVEVWLDNIEQADFFKHLSAIVKQYQERLLGVCKKAAEKGTFQGTDTERVDVLLSFLESGGTFADVDVTQNSPENIRRIDNEKLILSYHNFNTSEDLQGELERIFHQMQMFKPAVYKFAITPKDEQDLAVFLDFIRSFPNDLQGIFTTMGDLGLKGRQQIAETGKNWGAFYAIDDAHKTASGQPILDDLEKE